MGVRALYTAATGMDAQMRRIDVIANNVANVNTVGFRRDRVNFADLFYEAEHLIGASGPGNAIRPSGTHIGTGVRFVSTEKEFQPGGVKKTGDPLHIAIQGGRNVFFRIETLDGRTAYTRSGNFTLNDNGEMVTPSGDLLVPRMTIPQEAKTIEITPQGIVEVNDGWNEENQQIGQINLVRFVNPAGLEPMGDNLFVETQASGSSIEVQPGAQGAPKILQGHLEESNVNAVRELIELIQGQRAYEINSNVIRAADEALRIVNNVRG